MRALPLDTYTLRARAFPVYLTCAPIVLVLASVAPEGLKLELGGTTAVLFLPLAFLLSQVGGDAGKRLEPGLWKSWGGPPTTRFLRHTNREFNLTTRERIHERLRALGLRVPTQEEEFGDQEVADTAYQACTEELIRRTRNTTEFPLVFKELTAYGFRRNLLGLRPVGLPLAFSALVVIAWHALASWRVAGEVPPIDVATGLLCAALLLAWLAWVNARTVSLGANRFARFLLEAALGLN